MTTEIKRGRRELTSNFPIRFVERIIYPTLLSNINNIIKFKYVTYSSQGSHIGQLDFCNWLEEMAVRRDNVISITLRQV